MVMNRCAICRGIFGVIGLFSGPGAHSQHQLMTLSIIVITEWMCDLLNLTFLSVILKTCHNWSGDSLKYYAISYLNEAYCFSRKTCD